MDHWMDLCGSGDHTLVWHRGRAVTRGGFAHAARQLARRLPDQKFAVNLAAGRLAFLLGLAAAGLRRQVTLLPPNQTPAALDTLRREYPSQHVIDDGCLSQLDWQADGEPLRVAADDMAAILFTSGSTGTPQPQVKTWRSLIGNGDLDMQRFVSEPATNIVATVPSQHMFGLQTTVFLPLRGDCAIHDSRPFFPADIRGALEALPPPRALVITPLHLRHCLDGGLHLPSLAWVLSATAPLSAELARQAETQWGAPVFEIYGSTEAGTIGTRRTSEDALWRLPPGARLEIDAETTRYHAAHLPTAIALSDRAELASPQTFRLLGRDTDRVKIAGKRGSLAELTHALLGIAGVEDGVIFMPDDAVRTAALVVAPRSTAAAVLDALAERIDSVFLPRPLLLVERLPRNDVGKLPRAALLAALKGTA